MFYNILRQADLFNQLNCHPSWTEKTYMDIISELMKIDTPALFCYWMEKLSLLEERMYAQETLFWSQYVLNNACNIIMNLKVV